MTGRLRAVAQEFGSESLCSLRQGKSDGGWTAIAIPSLSWPLTPATQRPSRSAAATQFLLSHRSMTHALGGMFFSHHLPSSQCSTAVQFHHPSTVRLLLAADCVYCTASSRLLGDAQLAQAPTATLEAWHADRASYHRVTAPISNVAYNPCLSVAESTGCSHYDCSSV
jgi:hypothetical protein